MAWSSSSMFREWPSQAFQASGTGYTGLDSDTVNVALYNNSATPDKDAAVSLTGYNATSSAWVTANEVTDSDGSSDWSAGGLALSGKTFSTPATGVMMFDATDLSHANTVTLTNAFGCLVYDNTITGGSVAKQGVTFHYFGGGQSVTAGTFTIVWHANGLFRITCS